MADSPAFVTLCEALEQGSPLDRLEARGTVRLALKQAGLEARSATVAQLQVLIEKVLPNELESRGVDLAIVSSLKGALDSLSDDGSGGSESPEDVFGRLGK
jgi:hypothetical protein